MCYGSFTTPILYFLGIILWVLCLAQVMLWVVHNVSKKLCLQLGTLVKDRPAACLQGVQSWAATFASVSACRTGRGRWCACLDSPSQIHVLHSWKMLLSFNSEICFVNLWLFKINQIFWCEIWREICNIFWVHWTILFCLKAQNMINT